MMCVWKWSIEIIVESDMKKKGSMKTDVEDYSVRADIVWILFSDPSGLLLTCSDGMMKRVVRERVKCVYS